MNPPSTSPSLDDFEYNTDQSTRVARRVAYGVYRLTHGGQDIGEEVWGIFALRNGNTRLMTEIDLQWPVANQQRAHLDVDDQWRIRGLWAQVDLNNNRRIATYIPSGDQLDVLVVESRLHDEEERSGKSRLRGNTPSVNTPLPRINVISGKPVLQSQLPFDASTHLDFASVLFNFVVLQRLRLARSTRATFDSVVLTLPSLEPLSVQQTYAYERDELLRNDANQSNQPPAHRYRITETSAPDAVTTFWTDAHDIVIRQELMLEGVAHVCEMVSYRWQG
jgi:hypothetical protein